MFRGLRRHLDARIRKNPAMYEKVSYDDRACEYCGKDFTPNRRDKKYCKNTCQKAASLRRQPDFRERKRGWIKPHARNKGNTCVCCGFVATHPCQLDVDHINGTHSDNRPENLQTLCANCHRLKTYLNRENYPVAYR